MPFLTVRPEEIHQRFAYSFPTNGIEGSRKCSYYGNEASKSEKAGLSRLGVYDTNGNLSVRIDVTGPSHAEVDTPHFMFYDSRPEPRTPLGWWGTTVCLEAQLLQARISI